MDKEFFCSEWAKVRFGYDYHENENHVGSFTFPAFAAFPWLRHGFSARTGGLSTGSLSSLNLSFTREEEPRETTMQNYRIFCEAEGIPVESMVMDAYEHGTTVLPVDSRDCGKGYTLPPLPACDGIATNDPDVTLMTGHADCMAFYVIDAENHAIGLAHAGWRGAFHRIGCELVRVMREKYGSETKQLYIGVGPSICKSCFEVDLNLGVEFQRAFPGTDCLLPGKCEGKAYVDLWKVAVCQFLEAGVPGENISVMGLCTVEDERLFSFRGDHRKTGGATAYMRLCSC